MDMRDRLRVSESGSGRDWKGSILVGLIMLLLVKEMKKSAHWWIAMGEEMATDMMMKEKMDSSWRGRNSYPLMSMSMTIVVTCVWSCLLTTLLLLVVVARCQEIDLVC